MLWPIENATDELYKIQQYLVTLFTGLFNFAFAKYQNYFTIHFGIVIFF